MTLLFDVEYYPKLSNSQIQDAVKIINVNKEKWDEPFFIDTESYVDIDEIKTVSEEFISDSLKNIIVLGTGGSIQTLLALKHLSSRTIYPITSSRAEELNHCLKNTSPDDSVVIPISRGGETLDVNSTIGTFVEKGYKFLGLSSRGTMNDLLKEIGSKIMDVPDLSGRFAGSITNVGLVPAHLSGINIDEFLEGLKQGYDELLTYDRNSSLEIAALLYNLYEKGYKVAFSMPYSHNIEGGVGLLVQEISESTGKEGRGLMGAYQEAPLCQHSVLEYLLGGTKGAVVPIVWTIEDEQNDLELESSIDYVDGNSAQSIINYQADATFQALIEQKVPCIKISIKNTGENAMGQIVSFIQSMVYYLCLLIDVNWANNPKVVIGKKICNEALEKKLSSSERKNIRENLAKEKFADFFNKE